MPLKRNCQVLRSGGTVFSVNIEKLLEKTKRKEGLGLYALEKSMIEFYSVWKGVKSVLCRAGKGTATVFACNYAKGTDKATRKKVDTRGNRGDVPVYVSDLFARVSLASCITVLPISAKLFTIVQVERTGGIEYGLREFFSRFFLNAGKALEVLDVCRIYCTVYYLFVCHWCQFYSSFLTKTRNVSRLSVKEQT